MSMVRTSTRVANRKVEGEREAAGGEPEREPLQIRRSYHHGDLARAVLERARERLESDGEGAVSLRAIARDLDVDVAAIYRHFRSREALLSALAREAFAALAEAMERGRTRAGEDPEKALVAVGVAYVAFATRRPRVFEAMFAQASRVPFESVVGRATSGRDPASILSESWAALARERDVPPDGGGFALWSAVHGAAGLIVLGLGPDGERRRRAAAERVCRAIVAGAIADAGTPRAR